PEYKRELARASMNLGNLLESGGRLPEAQSLLRRAIVLNSALMDKQPADVQVRLDLAKSRTNLGESFRDNGHPERSIAQYEKSRDLAAALVKQFPDSPRYREQLAGTVLDLALAYDAAGNPAAQSNYLESLKIDEALVHEFPDNANYKVAEGLCLMDLGAYVRESNRNDEAESYYLRALAVLKDVPTDQSLRQQAGLYSNLGDLRHDMKKPGAEEALLQSIAISEKLVARKPPARGDRTYLAIAQNNLGEALKDTNRTDEAGKYLDSAIAGFDSLARESPKAVDIQDYLGYSLETQAELMEKIGQPEKARKSIEAAVQHQQNAVTL